MRIQHKITAKWVIRAALAAACLSVFALLGFHLGLRFNYPSRPEGNWQWRYRAAQLDRLFEGSAGYLRELADLHGRLPEAEENPPGRKAE